jgi:hydrogenase-4 component B
MTTLGLLLSGVALLLAGAMSSLALARNRGASGWVSVAFSGAAAFPLWAVVVRTFAGLGEPGVTLLRIPGLGAGLTVSVDGLSAVFLAITATIGFLTTLYSVRYMERYPDDTVAKYYPVLQILFVGIIGVVTTGDFFFFLVFWELMTLASFFLVIFERENREAQKAGLKYFLFNQAAALGMIAAVLVLWSRSGSFDFEALRIALGMTLAGQPLLGHLVLLLFFLGFATKGGILPMGSWLPDAYPAAPSGATAAFGGTMTKLGVYGILRVFLHLLPDSPATTIWGFVIALCGLGSLFVGTLTALKQDDAKRLMSFHVIGQVGYMFLGIGIGLALLRTDPLLGTLGLLAGVFHMLNHSLYKSCLFLGAGAVEYRTGTRSLGSLGGLGMVMAVTAACALVASLAIAGVPPLNGFASKWMMYAAAILGGESQPLFPLAGLVAMFISLVTLASFLKYLGSAFMGPRSGEGNIREVPGTMVVPQVFLAGVCLLFGLFPMVPVTYLHQALVGLPEAQELSALPTLMGGGPGLTIAPAGFGLAVWAPLPIALGLLLLAGCVYLGIQRVGGAEVREVPIWTCGEEEEPAALRYSAGSFYLPFKHAFRGVYPTFKVHPPAFPRALRQALNPDGWLYVPVVRWVEHASRIVSRTHVGVPQVYLLWIVLGAAVVVAVVLLAMG